MDSQETEKFMKPVSTIAFDKDGDGDLIQMVNNYAEAFNRHVMSNISARNAVRNLLMRVLPVETQNIIKSAKAAC